MFSHRRNKAFGRTIEYTSAQDFCRIFHNDMDVLYWLALVLTAHADKAEECFVAGLEECMDGNAVLKEWARSWSKRVVIKNAVRLTSPRPGAVTPAAAIPPQNKAGSRSELALADLQPFDRFVFVMSVLEGYADRDCGALLASSPTDVVEARFRALRHLGTGLERSPALQEERGSPSQDTRLLAELSMVLDKI